MTPESQQRDGAEARREPFADGGRRFARRIDCAPSPRKTEIAAEPHRGHGSGGRAPGEAA
jgi:hypothetical protein